MATRIGKCMIEVVARGCTGCGTQWSSGWTCARELQVLIGNRSLMLSVPLCADCNGGGATLAAVDPAGTQEAIWPVTPEMGEMGEFDEDEGDCHVEADEEDEEEQEVDEDDRDAEGSN